MYKVEGVSRNHMAGKKSTDVQMLSFHFGTKLDYLPKDVHLFFPNLHVYTCDACGIMFVGKEDLHPFPKLKVVSFSQNRIKSLAGNLFQYTPDLVSMDFSNGTLETIGKGFFEAVPKLKEVLFWKTKCHPGTRRYPVERQIHFVKQQCQSENRKSDGQAMLEKRSEMEVAEPMKVEEADEMMQTSQAVEVMQTSQADEVFQESKTSGDTMAMGSVKRRQWAVDHAKMCETRYELSKDVQGSKSKSVKKSKSIPKPKPTHKPKSVQKSKSIQKPKPTHKPKSVQKSKSIEKPKPTQKPNPTKKPKSKAKG
jgi:hypothetical protein